MPEAIATGLREEKKEERKDWGFFRSVGLITCQMHSDHLRTANQGYGNRTIRTGSDTTDIHAKNTTMDTEAETAFASDVHFTSRIERKGMGQMNTLEKDVERMEMQIGQLITYHRELK